MTVLLFLLALNIYFGFLNIFKRLIKLFLSHDLSIHNGETAQERDLK